MARDRHPEASTHLPRIIGGIVALALLTTVVAAARPDEVWVLLRRTDRSLLVLAAGSALLSLVMRGVRLACLLEPRMLSSRRGIMIAASAQAAALFAPLRTGEIALPILISRVTGRDLAPSVGTLLTARALDLASLGVWAGAAVLFVRGFGEPIALAVSLALLLPALLLPGTLAAADRAATSLLAPRGRLGRRWTRRVRAVRRELTTLRGRPARFLAASALSLVMWAFQWLLAGVLLMAMGFRWPASMVVAGSAAAAVANLLPFNLVGNLGTLEAGWTAAFAALGVPLQAAAATGLATHFWGLVFAAFFGIAGWSGLRVTSER